MPTNKYDQSTSLVLRAAYMYYISGKSQQEIAKVLKISITTVSRLLQKARAEKIVEFVIRDPLVECLDLETELKERLGISDVIIAPAVSLEPGGATGESDNVKNLVALEAARYLQRIITDNDVIGFTWGSTVCAMIGYLNPAQKVNADFVTLHGSLASSVPEWDVRVLVSQIAKAFSGTMHVLLTETLMDSPETVKVLKREKSIASVFDMFDKVNIAINGIGVFYPKTTTILAEPSFIPPEDVARLRGQNVVGDIAIRFFNHDGNECDTPLRDRTISIETDQFKRIPNKVTVASGTDKAYGVRCAAKGNFIDTLIVDSDLGREILRIIDEEEQRSQR